MIEMKTYYICSGDEGTSKTEARDEKIFVNKDHVAMIKDITLTFHEEDEESVPVSKVIFSNGLSILVSTADSAKLK